MMLIASVHYLILPAIAVSIFFYDHNRELASLSFVCYNDIHCVGGPIHFLLIVICCLWE